MKTSKIKRLVPKKVARRLVLAAAGGSVDWAELVRREGAETIAKMRSKGYELATCLESGEGVFVREEAVVGLHIQLSTALYRKLDAECRRRGTTKRSVVEAALEAYLASSGGSG